MAVPFYVPASSDHDESVEGGSNSSQSPNTTTSATQTPLQSPVNGEHLVQAFCEALYRCSMNNGSPAFQFPPPSPSCSIGSTTSAGPYSSASGGEIFFPRDRPITPRSPRNSVVDEDGIYYRMPRPYRNLVNNSSRRSTMTSTNDVHPDYYGEQENDNWDERYENFSSARDNLEEFSGRIPPRKKKKQKPKSKNEHSFAWPTVVTVFVFAMGCGFLVAR